MGHPRASRSWRPFSGRSGRSQRQPLDHRSHGPDFHRQDASVQEHPYQVDGDLQRFPSRARGPDFRPGHRTVETTAGRSRTESTAQVTAACVGRTLLSAAFDLDFRCGKTPRCKYATIIGTQPGKLTSKSPDKSARPTHQKVSILTESFSIK